MHPLPPMCKVTHRKESFKSFERLKTGYSSSSNENHRNTVLPSIQKPEVISVKKEFITKTNYRANSNLRNSTSESPFISVMSPFRDQFRVLNFGYQGDNTMSLSERKQSTIKRNNSNSSLYTKEKENVSDNINLRASLKDGFNATFSKNGTISAAETPIKPPTQREINKSIIEVRQLDNSSDGDSEFNRSESEISNINDIKTKFSTNQSA
jgi:hypothetical protein